MQAKETNLSDMVPRGSMASIAQKLGISRQAVSQALKAAKPNNPAVQEALKLAESSGALEAAQQLAKLTPVAQAA